MKTSVRRQVILFLYTTALLTACYNPVVGERIKFKGPAIEIDSSGQIYPCSIDSIVELREEEKITPKNANSPVEESIYIRVNKLSLNGNFGTCKGVGKILLKKSDVIIRGKKVEGAISMKEK